MRSLARGLSARRVAAHLLDTCHALRSPRQAARTATMAAAESSASPQRVKLALCQMKVSDDKDANIAKAQRYIKESASNGANIVVLPEMWNCPYSNDSFPTYAEDLEAGPSPSTDALQQAAKDFGVVIVGGSVPERRGEHLYNACCVYDADGSLVAKHRKTHLFDINIPGKITFRESDTLTGGTALTTATTRYGTLGIGICYDLRFPELAAICQQRGAQLLVYPGAFNMTTGPLHWSLLQRARAVDNQLFVCTCSPARDEEFSYVAWGHSLVVGPFGEVLNELEHEEGVLYQELDFGEARTRRENMPLEQQRRADLYEVVDKGIEYHQ